MIPTLAMAFAVTAAVLQTPAFQAYNDRFYRDLFRVPPEARAQLPAAPPQPRVVCGMVVVPIDPNFDARMRILTPDRPDHKIREIRPAVCVD